jgi:hypothetical protein
MIHIPTPQRTHSKRIAGEFYPLQKDELIALKEAKLINNAAFVHLALRYENPFCDRPIEIVPKEFALRWSLPESSVYEAMGKLKKLGVLIVKTGKVIIEWVKTTIPIVIVDSQQGGDSDNSETLRDSRIDSEIPEKFLSSQNEFQKPRKNSELPENQPLEPLVNLASIFPQTIQTIQTFQTPQTDPLGGDKGGGLLTEPEANGQGENEEIKQAEGLKQEQEIEAEKVLKTSVSGKDKMPCAVVRSITEVQQTTQIPQDLINKLNELEIPLDSKVRAAIAKHHISQAYGAARHVEDTWDTINNPRSVFLYQLPKQAIETMPKSLSQEFLDWYQGAIADGIVEDRPPEWLPKNQYNEPRVYLKDGRLMEWKRLRDEGFDPLATPEQMAAFFAKIRQQFGRMK